jgi:predicted chitinase
MIYTLSNINRNSIRRGISALLHETEHSIRQEPSGALLNCFLMFLCVILMILSTNHQIKPQTLTAHLMQMGASLRPLKAVNTVAQPDENVIINKLADEASKNSPTSPTEVKQNIATIVDSLKKKDIATPRVIAYAIATAQRETDNTFKPIEEYGGPQQAIALGYSGGERYYGRGYIQITHDYNYEKFGEKIGMGEQLVNNPDLALQPKIASDILAEFFKENEVAQKAERDFVEARQPINGTDHAESIAMEAEKYLQTIEQAGAIAYK